MKKLFMLLFIVLSLFAKDINLTNRIYVDNYQDLQYAINNMPENSIIDANVTDFDKNISIVNKKNLAIVFHNDVYDKLIIKNSKNIDIYGSNKAFRGVMININKSNNIYLKYFYILNPYFKLNKCLTKINGIEIA